MAKPKHLPAHVRAAQALRQFWRAGNWANRKWAEYKKSAPEKVRFPNKMKTLEELGAERGLIGDTVQKARRAAKAFSRKAIDELCRLVRECRAAFSVSHLIRLLSVPGRAARVRLARRAIRERWSTAQLESFILARHGRRKFGGRRPHVPQDSAERLVCLELICLRWRRWCEEAASLLPVKLRMRVEEATEAVRRVQADVAKRLRPSRQPDRKSG